MSQKYSITPEGATEAAKEIVDSEWTCCHANPATVTELAAIILRHAEQGPEGMKTPWCLNGHEVLTPGCESCLLDLQKRYNDALRKVQGEGEMREALRHAVSCMDRSCKRCNELQRELGPAGREEKRDV